MKSCISKSLTALVAGLSVVGMLDPWASAQAQDANLSTVIDNEGTPISGGTLKYAMVGDPFSGVLSPLYSDNGKDYEIVSMFSPNLFGNDANYKLDDSGFGKIKFDKDNKKVTITIPQGTKWDDGEPITIEDVIYPYYVIGHKDYTGVRYGSDFQNVVGMEEYHAGTTDTISGLKKVDDYTLEVTYKKFSNSMLQAWGGVSNYLIPKHAYENIPIKEQADSDLMRKNPVGFGPFKVKSITPGESVILEANEYYYKGKPKIDTVQMDVVNASTSVSEMKAGNYDIASLPADSYSTYKDATNFKTIGQVENRVQYLGFHLGKWNADKQEVEVDESKIVNNKSLRQAMGYAVDNGAIGQRFYEGLRWQANSPIPPTFKDIADSSREGYTYQPEKAKQILADAGFVDKDGDGFVEDPKGNQFSLKYLATSGTDVAEPIAQYYVDSWKQVGINVELYEGRLHEFNSFYDLLGTDADIDVFSASMGFGGDPNPAFMFGRNAQFNFMRYASEQNDSLLKDIRSDASFDADYRKEAFKKWQDFIMDEVPMVPTLYSYQLTTFNNRIKHYDATPGADFDWNQVELTADEPIKE